MAAPLVNFMIVGAQKAGTSALARFLGAHPEICMAEDKEAHLFDAPEYSRTWTPAEIDERYAPRFRHRRDEPQVGEATPIYLYWPFIAHELARYNPGLRLIVLLRDPVDRALSHYRMERGRGAEPLSPLRAMLAERDRLRRDRGDTAQGSSWRAHSYADRGRYRIQLENLGRSFPDRQILLLRSEALWQRHEESLHAVFAFLGVTPAPTLPARERVFATETGVPGARLARAWLALRLADERRRLEQLLPVAVRSRIGFRDGSVGS